MRRHKNWIKAYLDYTKHSESPEEFHLWVAVGTIGGALRRRVWIDQRYFEWTPNFYIVLVGPPGVAAKSTTLRLGQSLLHDVPGVHMGPQSMTWQSLTTALAEAAEEWPINGTAVNVKNFLDTEFDHMSAITCYVGELGTFLNPRDKELVDVLVALWDGQRETFLRKTKTQGDAVIHNPWINIVACTTPAWLNENFPEVMIGGGLTSRIVFVYGDKKRRFVAYPGLEIDSAEFESKRQDLLEDLQDISTMNGPMELTPDAIKWGQEWYKAHWTKEGGQLATTRFEGYMARKQTHLHKLAIVVSAAESSNGRITAEHLETAERFVNRIEKNMHKVFQSIGVSETHKNVKTIGNFLLAFGEMDSDQLIRKCTMVMSLAEFEDAINVGVRAKLWDKISTGKRLYYKPLKAIIKEEN